MPQAEAAATLLAWYAELDGEVAGLVKQAGAGRVAATVAVATRSGCFPRGYFKQHAAGGCVPAFAPPSNGTAVARLLLSEYGRAAGLLPACMCVQGIDGAKQDMALREQSPPAVPCAACCLCNVQPAPAAGAAPSPAALPTPADVRGWGAGQLKRFLQQRGVNHSSCVERQELMQLALAALAEGVVPGTVGAVAGAAASSPAEPMERVCAACGSTTGKLRKCVGCMSVFFCNAACQAQAWPTHKAACRRAAGR